MGLAQSAPVPHIEPTVTRTLAENDSHTVLPDIYQETVNIAVWRRTLSDDFTTALSRYISTNNLNVTKTLRASDIKPALSDIAPDFVFATKLQSDIAVLVEMFSVLFDLEYVGFRLRVLNTPMCPRFHVDKVPCRMVSTFCGTGTQWLPHHAVERKKLGHGANGLADEASGLILLPDAVQTLNAGDVALLKGELWEGNEGAGLVHRSPVSQNHEKRLLLTLDYA